MIVAAEEHFQREFPETANAIQETCENWRVFPVSATGPIVNGRPPETLRPTGVAAPIIWLLRTADRTALVRAEEYFEQHKHELFAKTSPSDDDTFYQRAIYRYEQILAKCPDPATSEQANAGVDRLNQKSLELVNEYVKTHERVIIAKPDKDFSHTYHQIAIQRYEQIHNNCTDPATRDQVKAGIERVKKVAKKQKIVRCLIPAGCAVIVLLMIWSVSDYFIFENARKQLINARLVAEEIDPAFANANTLLDSPFHPAGGVLGWKKSLAALITERNSKWEVDLKNELISFTYEDTTRADELVSKCSKFLERFKDSNFRGTIESLRDKAVRFSEQQKGDIVATQLMEQDDDLLKIASKDISQLEKWTEDAKSFLDTQSFLKATRRSEVQTALASRMSLLAELSAEKDWAALKSRYAELGESPLDQYLAVRQWLADKGQAQTIHADEANRMIAESLAAADSKAWLDLQEYKTKNSTNYQRHVEKANEYLARVEFSKNREEVLAFRTKVLSQWDQQLYRFITEEIKGRDLTGDQLLKIKGKCESYLDSDTRPVSMRSDVDTWLTWYRRLEAGVTAEVELQSVKVDRGSRWHGSFYYPDVFVTVKVNGRSDSTGEKALSLGIDTSGFSNSKLGPFSWKLGDQDVVVTITCTDGIDETILCSFPQDDFRLRHLNRTLAFDGGRINVRLKCPAANPPTLPPYESAP
jgi:hypothetical protein